MKVGSLFAGVGGFDRGLELAGHSIAWQVEINDFSNRVLERRWPHTPRGTDVREWTCLCQPLETYNANACTCPDGHRYQAIGNAVTVPVIEWFGKRLMKSAPMEREG